MCDDASYTCVKLANNLHIYMKQVNKFLAFVCVIRDEIFSENRGIMDYNLTLFKDSVRDILLSTSHHNQQHLATSSHLNSNSNLIGNGSGGLLANDLSNLNIVSGLSMNGGGY